MGDPNDPVILLVMLGGGSAVMVHFVMMHVAMRRASNGPAWDQALRGLAPIEPHVRRLAPFFSQLAGFNLATSAIFSLMIAVLGIREGLPWRAWLAIQAIMTVLIVLPASLQAAYFFRLAGRLARLDPRAAHANRWLLGSFFTKSWRNYTVEAVLDVWRYQLQFRAPLAAGAQVAFRRSPARRA